MLVTVSKRGAFRRALLAASCMFYSLTASLMPLSAQPANTGGANQPRVDAGLPVESLFKDFLHYARMGRFTLADAYAKTLLNHPDLDPVALLSIADQDKEAVHTLLILIKNSTIGENAAKVLDLLSEGQRRKRKSADRIRDNILKLGGDPQQEYYAIKHLAESGEYAIPQMIQALLNPQREQLWSRVINALPKMGKPAVGPLVIALSMKNNDVRIHLINALGQIGYAQAIPYLKKIIADANLPPESRQAAKSAVERIESITGQTHPGSPEESFTALAQRYYNEDDVVRADPRMADANVWYWDGDTQSLNRKVVPTPIFGPVMAMRCCEEALLLRNDHGEAIALWLAANIRRESRLGLDVESGQPIAQHEMDHTRPEVFPRALYFTQAAGPRYAHLVLDRAVGDHDSAVALGAIRALRITAGPSSLIGQEDYKQPLVKALQFSDIVVRLRAALALGSALPKTPFDGSDFVIPVLASGLSQTGRDQILVVDPDESNLNRVVGELRGGDRDVIGDTDFFKGLDRAAKELQALTGLFISTDVQSPDLGEALARFRESFIHAKTPVVLLIKPRQDLMARQAASADDYVETVDAVLGADELQAAFERVRNRSRQARLNPDLALSLALESAETLRRIVVDGGTVLDADVAEPALIGALSSEEERLQTLAASVLALLDTPTAQRAVAHVALDDANSDSLRIAAFGSLAESAKRNGNLLETNQIGPLVDIARHDRDLTMRTAASQALGAINLATDKASEIIRSYYGG